MLDDVSFAIYWRQQRESFNPRSRWLLQTELVHKGIDQDIIDDVLQEMDDCECAYRAAQKKASSLANTDYKTFKRKMVSFLRTRGFSYEVANSIIERHWNER